MRSSAKAHHFCAVVPMSHGFAENPSLTVALAMAAGMLCQAIARHLRIPGIVVLLLAGVALGPDVAGVVNPESMGRGLHALVGFAVAVILFEGGLNLRMGHLRRQAVPIRRLVLVGPIVTTLGASAVAYFVMRWELRLSLLFGTLVIVTGPTVVTPLLRQMGLRDNVATILEAEGIFIDAIGATIAVVALEVALAPTGLSIAGAIPDIAMRIGTGAVLGAAGGAVLAALLHFRHVIPHGLANTVSLGFAVAIYQVSNAVLPESGITAAIMAGFVVGNAKPRILAGLVEFKEQLTVLLIATLFVLLAADIRMQDIIALGWNGVLAVVLLMVVVRPATVAVATWGTDVSRAEKVFLSWLAPRGIVAAAVASLFALTLHDHGIDGGTEMRALVFLVIAMTVTIQGLSGKSVASFLGLRKVEHPGVLILGANPLALTLATEITKHNQDVALIDSNPDACRRAEEAGFRIYYGNGLEERTLTRAHAQGREACVAITPNESVNTLFAREIQTTFHGPKVYVVLESTTSGVTETMAAHHDALTLFGNEVSVERWNRWIESDRTATHQVVFQSSDDSERPLLSSIPSQQLLPLIIDRKNTIRLADASLRLKRGDRVTFILRQSAEEDAFKWLGEHGFLRQGGNVSTLMSAATD